MGPLWEEEKIKLAPSGKKKRRNLQSTLAMTHYQHAMTLNQTSSHWSTAAQSGAYKQFHYNSTGPSTRLDLQVHTCQKQSFSKEVEKFHSSTSKVLQEPAKRKLSLSGAHTAAVASDSCWAMSFRTARNSLHKKKNTVAKNWNDKPWRLYSLSNLETSSKSQKLI